MNSYQPYNNYNQNLNYPTAQPQPQNYNSNSRDNRDNRDNNSRDNYNSDRKTGSGQVVTDFAFRYGRNGATRTYINNEDEMFFREHVEQMKKKQGKIINYIIFKS